MVIQVFRLEKVSRFPFLDEFSVCGKKKQVIHFAQDSGTALQIHELGNNISTHWET